MRAFLIITAFLLAFTLPQSAKADDKIKDEIIKESIKDYKTRLGRPCPCSYNLNRAVRKLKLTYPF